MSWLTSKVIRSYCERFDLIIKLLKTMSIATHIYRVCLARTTYLENYKYFNELDNY